MGTTGQEDIRITQDNPGWECWGRKVRVRMTRDTNRSSQDKLRTSNTTSGCVVIFEERKGSAHGLGIGTTSGTKNAAWRMCSYLMEKRKGTCLRTSSLHRML